MTQLHYERRARQNTKFVLLLAIFIPLFCGIGALIFPVREGVLVGLALGAGGMLAITCMSMAWDTNGLVTISKKLDNAIFLVSNLTNQGKVGDILKELAQEADKAFNEQTRYMGGVGLRTLDPAIAEPLAKRVLKAKEKFWELHRHAKTYGFGVGDKIGHYLIDKKKAT